MKDLSFHVLCKGTILGSMQCLLHVFSVFLPTKVDVLILCFNCFIFLNIKIFSSETALNLILHNFDVCVAVTKIPAD